MFSPSKGDLGVLAVLMESMILVESMLAMQTLVVPPCEHPRPGMDTTRLDLVSLFPGEEVSAMPWRLHSGIVSQCYEVPRSCLNK